MNLILDDAVLVRSSPEEAELTVKVFVEGVLHSALIDCESFQNLITEDALRSVNLGRERRGLGARLGAINNTPLKVVGAIHLTAELGAQSGTLEFLVTEKMSDPLIILFSARK